MDDEAIAAVRAALGELNSALSKLPALGIEASTSGLLTHAHVISQPAAGLRIGLHLSRIKITKEIDVNL